MTAPLFTRIVAAVKHQQLIVICVLAVGVIAALYALVAVHPKYVATTTVLMVAEPPEVTNPNVPSTATKPLLSTDLPSLATNTTVLDRFEHDLGDTTPLDLLRTRIHAKVSPDSTVMPVQYIATDPTIAVTGANALGDEIVRFYRETATTRFDSLIGDFNGQLAARRRELGVLDGELAAAAKAYPYIDVNAPGSQANAADSVYGRLIALRTERDELQATVDADAAAAQATGGLVQDARPLAERDVVNSDAAYRNLRDQYAKDFAALKKLNAFGSDRYPGVAELRETVAREAQMVAAARDHAASTGPASNATYVAALDAQVKADALYAGDRAKLAARSAELGALNAQIGHGSVATDVSRIRRDHDQAEAAYALIAARLAKAIADRSEAASTGSVIILDRARFATKATFAGGLVIAIGILFLTVWLALTLAVMIDGHQAWFTDAQTVENVYGAKLIGSMV